MRFRLRRKNVHRERSSIPAVAEHGVKREVHARKRRYKGPHEVFATGASPAKTVRGRCAAATSSLPTVMMFKPRCELLSAAARRVGAVGSCSNGCSNGRTSFSTVSAPCSGLTRSRRPRRSSRPATKNSTKTKAEPMLRSQTTKGAAMTIEAVSEPSDLAQWRSGAEPFYLELFGETRPFVDSAYAELIPASTAAEATPVSGASAPVYEYWWTIGHPGLPQRGRALPALAPPPQRERGSRRSGNGGVLERSR